MPVEPGASIANSSNSNEIPTKWQLKCPLKREDSNFTQGRLSLGYTTLVLDVVMTEKGQETSSTQMLNDPNMNYKSW